MPETLYDWHVWWLNFLNDHPTLFIIAVVAAVAFALWGARRRRM